MRVAVVENTAISHLGQVGVALAEAEAEVEIFRPWQGGALPALADHDALVVLGGEQNARDDVLFPYLPALAALMREFGDAGRAVLGICLGSQILARAYGADNLIGTAPEFGWQHVHLSADGIGDAMLGPAAASFPIFQWHSDTFTLPPGAVRLASNGAVANQAFRVGRAAYGTQFHFEANSTVVEAWKTAFPQLIERIEPGWLQRFPQIAAEHAGRADEAGLSIARGWVAQIVPSA